MRKIWGAAGLAAAALVLSACASSGSSSAVSGSTPAAAGGSAASSAPASSSGGTTLAAKTIGGQQVVTNAAGFTLYWFVPDTSTTSKCTGSCATFWPPVKGPATAMSGVTGTLGTITRSDGTTQATYDGHPLYTYAAGGVWHEMTVSGATPAAGASAKASTGGGYGY
jgi:predicted lipoprotein with Yx(FWY)xxD motif